MADERAQPDLLLEELRRQVERIEGTKTRVMVEHLRAVDTGRLGAVAGALARAEMDDVDDALRLVLGLT